MVLNKPEMEREVSSPANLVKDFCAVAGRNAPSFNRYHFLYGLLDCSTQLARMLLPGLVPEPYAEQLDRFQQRMVRIIENSAERSLRWKAVRVARVYITRKIYANEQMIRLNFFS
jgi:hypothetical protein